MGREAHILEKAHYDGFETKSSVKNLCEGLPNGCLVKVLTEKLDEELLMKEERALAKDDGAKGEVQRWRSKG